MPIARFLIPRVLMPPRWLAVLIVAAWICLTGWLLRRELLPRLMPGQPPPLTIDLAEEAQTKRSSIAWTVMQNGKEVGVARTRIEHPRHDRFELIAEFPCAAASSTPGWRRRRSAAGRTTRSPPW